MTVTETERQLTVSDKCEVLVCGGGVAGIAAALAAAREGADVILLEREWVLGGLATAGLVTVYLPLCDGNGRQVSFLIAEELLRLSVKYGAEEDNDAWLGDNWSERKNKRFIARFNPNLFALETEKLLLENNVRILYGTSVCNTIIENNKITHIVIENKSGRSAIQTECVIDTTGDADVCKLAGEKTAKFRQGNVIAGWYYSVTDGKYMLNTVGASDIPDSQKTEEQLENDKNIQRFSGIDAKELSEMITLSHRKTLEHFLRYGDGTPSKALASVCTVPQIRMTRKLEGKYTIDDIEMHKEFDDSVGLFSDWRKPGPVYELPFRTLIGEKIKNLLVAGRCISTTDAMWDITRVIPVCAVSGQASGTAAAIYLKESNYDIELLQLKLRQSGVILHESEF